MSMTSIEIKTPSGSAAGTVELPAEVFNVQTNVPLIHQVVVAQLAAARQGTHKTKTRAEVAGGGTVHGPQPRSYAQKTPKKMKAAALRGALSDRARADRVHVVSSLVDGQTPSTKSALTALRAVTEAAAVLVVDERTDDVTWLSLRNVPEVHLLSPDQLNTYDVLVNDDVVFTQAALEQFLSGPRTGGSAKATATSTEAEAVEADAQTAEEESA